MELERRGVPTATIVTSGFVATTEAHRKLLKDPDLPYFVVPHPIVSMSDDELRASADAVFDEIVRTLSEDGIVRQEMRERDAASSPTERGGA